MIHKVKLKVRDEERWLTSIEYGYQVKFSDSPHLDKMIELHQDVSAKLGLVQPLPLVGGLIRLRFSSTDHDQFFYDWLSVSPMHNGSIEILRNEVETVSRINFWDCYCVSIEECMSADSAPMSIELVLSPAIIKKDGLVHEKIWKVSDIHGARETISVMEETKEEKEPEITAVYWKDAKGNYSIDELPEGEVVTLYAQTRNTNPGDKLSFTITAEDGTAIAKIENCEVDGMGIAKIVNFNLKEYRNEKKN